MPRNLPLRPAVPRRLLTPFAACWAGILLVLTATLPLQTSAAQPPAAERSQDNTKQDRKAERRASRIGIEVSS